MKKIIGIIFLLLIFAPRPALASFNSTYQISNFQSEITINKDTTLTVKETIVADFQIDKHGIYRVIPTIYSANGKTINAKLDSVSVSDENGSPYQFQISWLNQSRQIKIGDPDKTLIGAHTYVITYKLKNIIQRFNEHDELYWNVTGSEWDAEIAKVQARVISPYAKIINTKCFGNCQTRENAVFTGAGRDMTIVVALDKKNSLNFPGQTEQLINSIIDNWGYIPPIIPITLIFLIWFKRGRDKRFLSDNVYVKGTKQKTTDLFSRPHLPMVYSPIKGLTPSQIGTIIDEKVDTKDVVAEIVELARLGFIKIEKVEKKGFFRKSTDYQFTDLKKDDSSLKNYQKSLKDSLFKGDKDSVLLSTLKNNFYEKLDEFKKKLYENVSHEGYFSGNPEKQRQIWLGLYIVITVITSIIIMIFISQTQNFGPLAVGAVFFLLGLPFAFSMPRKTAWGYSLMQQIRGLKYFVGVGKWREEISEKNLFLEEILPIAISLGIVDKLAKDMKDLGLKSPEYLHGMNTAVFASDFSHFQRQTVSNLVSTPSGKSSWSGGSGFSGGSSGGGFGGGGGGSW